MGNVRNRSIEVRRLPGQERSKETVHVILEAAKKRFGESGIDVVSMTELAKEAGVSKAVLYRYFTNKQTIVRALAEQEFSENRVLIESILETGNVLTPKESLVAGVTEYCQRQIKEPYRIKLRAAIHADPQLSELDFMDSRNNVEILNDITLSLYPEASKHDLRARLLLFNELMDSLVRLVSRVDEEETQRLIEEFVEILVSGIVVD